MHIAEAILADTNSEEKDTTTYLEVMTDPVAEMQHMATKANLKAIWACSPFFTRLYYVKNRENPIFLFLQPFPLLAPPIIVTTIIFDLTIGCTALMAIVSATSSHHPPLLSPTGN
jgi:hypothetical protein